MKTTREPVVGDGTHEGAVVVLSVVSSYPIQLTIRDLENQRFRLERPISVSVTQGTSGLVVADEDGLTYGVGRTLEEALVDYRGSLIVDLEVLQKNRDHLAQGLAEKLSVLESLIRVVD